MSRSSVLSFVVLGAESSPTPLRSRSDIERVIRDLGEQISKGRTEGVVLVGLLKGSLHLVADLSRALRISCLIDFIALGAVQPDSPCICIEKDLDISVDGREVVLVEDIVDGGRSTSYAVDLLRRRGARSVAVCALIDRPRRREVAIDLDYVGFHETEEHLVGYGIASDERFRNLPAIYRLRRPNEASEVERPTRSALS